MGIAQCLVTYFTELLIIFFGCQRTHACLYNDSTTRNCILKGFHICDSPKINKALKLMSRLFSTQQMRDCWHHYTEHY